MTTTTKLVEFRFLSHVSAHVLVSLNADVLVVVVVVGCVQGSYYSHCLPLTQNASKGVSE